jgi:hypothetical protein
MAYWKATGSSSSVDTSWNMMPFLGKSGISRIAPAMAAFLAASDTAAAAAMLARARRAADRAPAGRVACREGFCAARARRGAAAAARPPPPRCGGLQRPPSAQR